MSFVLIDILINSLQAFERCPSTIQELDAEIHQLQARADSIFQTNPNVSIFYLDNPLRIVYFLFKYLCFQIAPVLLFCVSKLETEIV